MSNLSSIAASGFVVFLVLLITGTPVRNAAIYALGAIAVIALWAMFT